MTKGTLLRPPPVRKRKGQPPPVTVPTMYLHLGNGRVMTFDNVGDLRKFAETRRGK